MSQRGTPAVAVPEMESVPPLALLSPVCCVRLWPNEPWKWGLPVADEREKRPAERRLIPQGTYRITANIVIEGDLTEEQLRKLIVHAEPTVAVAVAPKEAPAPNPELEARRERAGHLVEAYRAKLGEPPETLSSALVQWLAEGLPEDIIRGAIEETVLNDGRPGVTSRWQKYSYLKDVVRMYRNDGRPPKTEPDE